MFGKSSQELLYVSLICLSESVRRGQILSGCDTYLRHKHKLSVLSHLSDFVTCSACVNVQSEGALSQLWNIAGS